MCGVGYENVSGKSQDPSVTELEDASAIRIVASYRPGDYRLVGFHESASDVGGAQGHDNRINGIGILRTVGKYNYKAHVYSIEEYEDVADTGASYMAFGMDYAYSTHVVVYATIAGVSNEAQSSLQVVGVGHDDKLAVITGEDNGGASLGMRMKF